MSKGSLIYGWASSVWEKLISSGGRLFTALHGWDGAAWHKLPLLWGYTGRAEERVANVNADVGNNTLTGSSVPAGYVYVLQGASTYDNNNPITKAGIRVALSGTYVTIAEVLTLATAQHVIALPQIVMIEGDYVFADLEGCTGGDDIYLDWCGYSMKIAE